MRIIWVRLPLLICRPLRLRQKDPVNHRITRGRSLRMKIGNPDVKVIERMGNIFYNNQRQWINYPTPGHRRRSGPSWASSLSFSVPWTVCVYPATLRKDWQVVNASIYANGVDFLTEKFAISAQASRTGQMIFLICYAFGCELWAPWSEELGRRWTLQASLFLVNSTCLYRTIDKDSYCSMADPCCLGA
jgi:hypothetical protein